MNYFFIVAAGLLLVFWLFVQLYNETRAQIQQIRKMLDHVVLKVYKEVVRPAGYTDEKPLAVHPLTSTSTTCGRDIGLDRFQVDLQVETEEVLLKESAAEFCLEPYKNRMRLYVHPIEQPVIWYGDPKGKKNDPVYCILKDSRAEVPPLPLLFKGRSVVEYKGTQRPAPLQIGDVVILGDTRVDIAYEGSDAQ